MTSEYLDFALNVARRAGDVLNTNFRLGMTKTWKSDGTPVTVTDLMINDMILKSVGESFPHHAVIAEEGSSSSTSDWVWICDPIDGTVPFAHGVPTFVFSLALVHKGIPVLGVINDSFSDRLLVAEAGQGAFLNDERLHVSSVESFETLVIDFEDQGTALGNGSFRTRLKKRGVLVQTLWSSVYGCSRVASGDYAAMVSDGGYVWDAAAATVIVTEAGGRVTDLAGNPVSFENHQLNGWVVSNGEIHDALLEEIKR